MYCVFKSLIHQFSRLLNLTIEKNDFEDTIDAKNFLFNIILNEKNTKGQKIVILLDSIDQLHENDYNLAWMAYDLPKNVKFICSTLDKHGNILNNLRNKLLFDEKNYEELTAIEYNVAIKQLKQKLNNQMRDLQPSQWIIIQNLLIKAEKVYQLHIKLLFDITYKWTSTYLPSRHEDNIDDCVDINETIKYLFKKFELNFGTVIFKHYVFYLTIMQNGISESELEDIMSIDDEVLNYTFQKYEPSIRRFPNSILVRLRNELKEYLIEKEADNTTVLSWFNVSFINTSKQYYSDIFERSEKRDSILMNIIAYYNEEWRVKPKEYNFNGKLKSAVRYTKLQTMKFKAIIAEDYEFNRRKLNELVGLILMLNNEKLNIDYLMDLIYLNYEFVCCKAQLNELKFLFNVHEHLIGLYNTIKDNNRDLKAKLKELIEISEIYVNNYDTINEFPDRIPYEIISRVGIEYSDKMKNSIKSDFALVPLQCGFDQPIKLDQQTKKTIFVKDEKIKNFDIHWCFNSSYLLIECSYENSKKLKFINHLNGFQISGEIEIDSINVENNFIRPFLKTEIKDNIQHINDIDGGLLYFKSSNNNNLFMRTFKNESYQIKAAIDSSVKNFFFISLKCCLIEYMNFFEIIDFNDSKKLISSFVSEVFSSEIIGIVTTMPQDKHVYMSDYDLVDYTIICVLLKHSIKIYKFDKITNKFVNGNYLVHLDLTHEIYVNELNNTVNCMIDRYFSIESILMDNRLDLIKSNSNEEFVRILAYNGGHLDNTQLTFINIDNDYNAKCNVKTKKNNNDWIEIYDYAFDRTILGLLYVDEKFGFAIKHKFVSVDDRSESLYTKNMIKFYRIFIFYFNLLFF